MDINFVFSQTDTRPMYLQIMAQVKQRVAVGDWPPGTKMPSIRELAVAAKVSVITVKRAYLELERSGVIVTRQGKGSWVSDEVAVVDMREQELQQVLQRAIALADAMDLPKQDLVALLQQTIDKEQ